MPVSHPTSQQAIEHMIMNMDMNASQPPNQLASHPTYDYEYDECEYEYHKWDYDCEYEYG